MGYKLLQKKKIVWKGYKITHKCSVKKCNKTHKLQITKQLIYHDRIGIGNLNYSNLYIE